VSFSHYRKRHYRVITGNRRDQEYNHREYDYRKCDCRIHNYGKCNYANVTTAFAITLDKNKKNTIFTNIRAGEITY